MKSGRRDYPGAITGPNGHVIVANARWARTRRERRRGLIGSPPLPYASGLVIERARQVHTFGMKFPIDVLFCDREWRVRHIVLGLRPSRVTRFVFGARFVIELPVGAASGLKVGDRLRST